jgi:hypothetical protein
MFPLDCCNDSSSVDGLFHNLVCSLHSSCLRAIDRTGETKRYSWAASSERQGRSYTHTFVVKLPIVAAVA